MSTPEQAPKPPAELPAAQAVAVNIAAHLIRTTLSAGKSVSIPSLGIDINGDGGSTPSKESK